MKASSIVLICCIMVARSVLAEEAKSLEECIELALQHHPSLRAGVARVRAAEERTRQVASAYLPQIDATYAANRRSTSVAARTGTTLGTATQTFNFFNTGVSFSQLLFDFGQTFHNLQAAQAQVEASMADLDSQKETVIFNVKQAYFALLSAERLQEVAVEALRQSEKHLELAKGRYDVGLAPRLDVTREQAQVATNQLNVLRAENNLRLGRETLRNAMGMREPVTFALRDVPYTTLEAESAEELVQQAWLQRPEIQSLEAQIRAAEQQLLALERNHLPVLTGAGQYQWSGAEFPLQPNWNIGAALTLPLFRGGLTVSQVSEARQNLAALRHDAEVLRQTVALEVRQAVLRVEEAAKTIHVAREAVRQAREALELAEGRYATGVGSIIEVTDAQATFVSARGQEVQSLYDHQNAVAAVERAIGAGISLGQRLSSGERSEQ
ncbi:MAG: TolC family protein [Candidatus Binatia bacterium]|nr:TolC family protein [Candidatus Binatia bacterium]